MSAVGSRSALAAGLGCRSGCSTEDIVAAVGAALARAGRTLAEVEAFYAPELKNAEAGLRTAALQLGKPLCLLPMAALRAHTSGALSASPRVLERFGVPSIAETAALAGACRDPGGVRARLLGPRVAVGGSTCALAVREPLR